jgi:nucleoside 2-deoxyribosyltransferase/predicted secreted protein
MYVLCSPCILDPALRAEGITKPSDLTLFESCRERCNKFGIEMVPLPCPETLYLGADRTPGTFLERLNTLEFFNLLGGLTKEVRKIIELRGSPLCILGVNSSPTCGVTRTYYGGVGNELPKRAGRGVFLEKFSDIVAIDAATFSQYRIYLAAPLFSDAERTYNLSVAGLLRDNFFEVFLPQESCDDSETRNIEDIGQIFTANLNALKTADMLVAIVDGADADSGTSWEMGYASALGKKVIGLRTDFRRSGKNEKVNLMLEESAVVVTSTDNLLEIIKSPLILKFDA